MIRLLRQRPAAQWAAFRWYAVLPALALALFVGVAVAFFWYLHRSEAEQQRQTLFRDVEWAQQTIRLRLHGTEDALRTSALEWADATRGDGDLLPPAARTLLQASPDVDYVGFIDNERRIAWVLPSDQVREPVDRTAGGLLADRLGVDAYDAARVERQPAYTPAFVAVDGAQRIELHVPVIGHRAFLGTIVVGYSLSRLIAASLPAELRARYRIELVGEGGDTLAAVAPEARRAPTVATAPAAGPHYELPLEPPGHGLRLRAWPLGTRPALLDRTLQAAVVGLSAAIVASLLLLGRFARSRAQAEAERDRLFELSTDVLCTMRADGRFVRVNPAFVALFGPGVRDLAAVAHPDDRAQVGQVLQRLGRASSRPDERRASFEVRCGRAGQPPWRWLVWSIRGGEAGAQSPALYAVAHDVTDRKAVETALATETAFRRAMEDSLLTGMRVFDLQGRIVYVNPAFCRMLDLRAADLVGAVAPFPYWLPDRHAEHQAELDRVLRGDAPRSGMQVRVRRGDGALLDVRMYVSPLVDAGGTQTGWLTSMADITEPTRVRRELEAAHERFATVLDELDVAVSVAARDGSDALLFANRPYRSLFGASAAAHRALAAPPAGLAGGEAAAEVLHAPTQRWFEVRTRGIRWVDGRMVGLLVAADVSARHEARELQRLQDERLQRTSRLVTMGEMASSLAHELNQPLTAIANYVMGIAARVRSAQARGRPLAPEELIAMLDKTARQAERAGQVLRRIRDFVKRSEPERVACEVADIVADALGLAEIDARRQRVRIETTLPDGAPTLYADPILIEQVLLNLVKNGIEAMRDAVQRTLRVVVRVEADAVQFEVIDAGPGLAPGAREKLFEPFFTTKDEGMGMGLNICRSIVELHQGRLWVRERAEGGCVFGFELPRLDAHAQRAVA